MQTDSIVDPWLDRNIYRNTFRMAISILVVDDDHDDLALFGEALMKVRPEVRFNAAGNGLEAIQYLSIPGANLPSIIILDINMPLMNGWDCISSLKSADYSKNIPVLIYTTSSAESDKEKAMRLGAICFVSKMQDYKNLKKMVERIVENLENKTPDLICPQLHNLKEM